MDKNETLDEVKKIFSELESDLNFAISELERRISAALNYCEKEIQTLERRIGDED